MIKNKISNNDSNYETLKNEFFNLSNNVHSIKNSLNYSNDTIKDIYLNSNSYLHNLQNYYRGDNVNGNEHPLGVYSEQVLNNLQTTFNEWSTNQSNYFESINDYCYQLDQIKFKIDRLDQLGSNTSGEFINLKNQIFKDVQLQFENRVNQFDIPLINIQFSFNSFLQSLNSNQNDNSFLLQKPINFNNPISSLQPINNNNSGSIVGGSRPIGNNNLQNIPRPQPPPIKQQQQSYPPQQQKYIAPQHYQQPQYQQPQYQQPQDVYTTSTLPTPPEQQPIAQRKQAPKSQLRQIERPPPVELPDKQVIEPDNLKRKPGDFLRDPNAPRFVPAPTEKYVAKNQPSMAHHDVSLSESRQQHQETLKNMSSNTPKPPSRPAPLPK